MAQFTHMQLRNWKNFTDVGVDLQQRVFLVGPNAVGKSNFLDSFRFLHDIAAEGEGLARAVARRGGMLAIRSLVAGPEAEVTIRVEISDRGELPNWLYEINLGEDDRRRPLVRGERAIRDRDLSVLSRFEPDDEGRYRSCLELVEGCPELRDLAEFFRSTREVSQVDPPLWEPSWPGSTQNGSVASDLVARIARTPKRTREPRLKRIGEALRAVAPQLEDFEFVRDDRGNPHLRVRFAGWESPDAWQTEERFSDGMLRFIELLWALLDGGGPLLIEHPEQSLHPAVVRYLPGLIWQALRRRDRQA